jgi:hypothetical protein
MSKFYVSNYVGRQRVRQLVSFSDDLCALYYNLGIALQQMLNDSHEDSTKTITIRLMPDEEFKNINPKVF